MNESRDKLTFYPFLCRDVFLHFQSATISLFGEAEAALLRSNSPRNSRTNGEVRLQAMLQATLEKHFSVEKCLKKPKKNPLILTENHNY